MNARAIESPWPSLVFALGLGFGAVVGTASLARSEPVASPERPAAETAPATKKATDFVCEARPGGWCDLRDWSGMDRWPVTLQSQLPE